MSEVAEGNEIESNADSRVTAEWLRSNTRIRGWLALFMLGLLLSPLWSLDETVVMVDPAECYGSIILATTGIVTVLGLLVVAIWTFAALHRRWPSAVFWARFFLVYCLLGGVLSLSLMQDEMSAREYGQAVGTVFLSIVWLVYFRVSKQVSRVIPRQYRHAGLGTWAAAALIVLLPFVWVVVGSFQVVLGYNGNVEIRQSELPEGELTEGHVVFRPPEGWSSCVKSLGEAVVCIMMDGKDSSIELFSILDPDDTKENFEATVESFADEDFDKLKRQTVLDELAMVNGNKCYYCVVNYESAFYRHFAVLFDSDTGKAVVLSGYFPTPDAKEMKGVLESTRFHR